MRFSFLILLSLSLFISSCKKDSDPIVEENPETSCVCLKENIGVTITNHLPSSGFLIMTAYMQFLTENPNYYYYGSVTAHFTSSPDLYESGNGNISVDSVFINNNPMPSIKDMNGEHMYYQHDFLSLPLQQEWSVFGANGIPTFTFSSDLKNPVADFSLIPDSISKSLVKSFKINGVSNITSADISIFAFGVSGPNISLILREGSNEVCFPEDQLKLISTGKATVSITMENRITKKFGDKNIALIKRLQYQKKIDLNP